MLELLLFLHQLPQNILGEILTRKPKNIRVLTCHDGETVKVYFTKNVFNCGVSLGDYIILDADAYEDGAKNRSWYYVNTVNHEHGHQKQSRMLGWLYLFIVGIISACNNLWDRYFHKQWTSSERAKWYYSRFPEKWADKLGGVNRFDI